MIASDDDARRDQDAPIAVESKEGERAENMEMSFDSTAGQVNQQTAHKHLSDANDVARDCLARQARPAG